MFGLLSRILLALRSAFEARTAGEAEILALRQQLCVANSSSRGGRSLVQPTAVATPAIRVQSRARRRGCGAVVPALLRPARVTPMLVVKRLVILELPFEVAALPKPDSIQILAPNGSD